MAAVSIAVMLPRELVEEVLKAARRRGGSFSELFVEERTSTSIRLDDRKVEELTSGLDRGAGVRVALGTSYGYAYSNRLDRDSLLQAAEAASAALQEGEPGTVVDLTVREGRGVNRTDRPADGFPAADKVAWLRELDDAARSLSPEVVQVVGMYGDSLQKRLIATSDGRWIEEDRPRIRLVTQVVAARDGTIQTGFFGPAACAGVELFDRFSANGDRREGGPACRDDARLRSGTGRRDGSGPRTRDGWRPVPRSGGSSARGGRCRQGGERLPRARRHEVRERGRQWG